MFEATTDEALMVLVKEKTDRKAFTELIKRYQKQAYLLALRLSGNPDDAMDAAQEAFVRMFTKASTYNSEKPYRPWFLRMVRNCTLNQIRTAFVRKRVPSAKLLEQLPDTTNDPQASYRLAQLWQHILALPFKLKEILILKHHQQLSYQQIAEVLGISVNTVATRIHMARKVLGERYEM